MKDEELYYYKLIIQRYKDYINEKEGKTITALKQMISPENDTVKKIVRTIYEENNIDIKKTELSRDEKELVAASIIHYLKGIKTVYPEVTFWPTFEEIEFIKAGDPMDKALLGCSLFISVKIPCKICVSEDNKHYLVYDIEEKRYFYQIEDDEIYEGTKLDLFLSKGVKFKYCFNNEQYTLFE